MPRLKNPATGTVVSVEGDLERRYRARGWAEPGGKPVKKAEPEKPSEDNDADKPATRRNTRRK